MPRWRLCLGHATDAALSGTHKKIGLEMSFLLRRKSLMHTLTDSALGSHDTTASCAHDNLRSSTSNAIARYMLNLATSRNCELRTRTICTTQNASLTLLIEKELSLHLQYYFISLPHLLYMRKEEARFWGRSSRKAADWHHLACRKSQNSWTYSTNHN